MKIAQERNLPRMIVVNKIDQGEDLAAFLEVIQESFGTECQPVNLQADGGRRVKTNDWDGAGLQRFREDSVVAGFRGALDASATAEQLEHVATLIPDEWLASAATGTPERCVEKIMTQFDLGCDGVILHGASPAELASIVGEYRKRRPGGRFEHLAANPAG